MCIHSLFECNPVPDYDMFFNNKNYPEQPAKMLSEALSDIQRKLLVDRIPTKMSFISVSFIQSQIQEEEIAAKNQTKVTTSEKRVKMSGKNNVLGNDPPPAFFYTRRNDTASKTVSSEPKVCTVPGIDFPEIDVPDFKYVEQADGLHNLLTKPESWTSFDA